jgi:hypothetical protein
MQSVSLIIAPIENTTILYANHIGEYINAKILNFFASTPYANVLNIIEQTGIISIMALKTLNGLLKRVKSIGYVLTKSTQNTTVNNVLFICHLSLKAKKRARSIPKKLSIAPIYEPISKKFIEKNIPPKNWNKIIPLLFFA